MSIERDDVNANYSCGHCKQCVTNKWTRNGRWATRIEQANNKRNTIRITFRGRTQSLQQWAKETGLPAWTIRIRIKDLKWSIAKALRTPKEPVHHREWEPRQ